MSAGQGNAAVGIVLDGTWYCSQAAAKQMISPSRAGATVNIIGTYAENRRPGAAHSGVAKAGVLGLTRSLAVE